MAASLMFNVAVRLLVACGVKVTDIVHVLLAATLPPQVSLSAKSPGLAPVKVMLAMLNAVGRLFVRVTVFAVEVPTACAPKLNELGDQATWAVAVPVRLMICGLLLAASLMFNVAVRLPVACGVKVTEIVHVLLATTLLPQVSVSAKSPGFAPVKVLAMLNAVGRLLVRVMFFETLDVPTACAPKLNEVGDHAT